MTSPENPPMKGKWIDLINESVHTVNDVDIGDIDAVNVDFIVVKRGYINIHYYYIPIHQVEGWAHLAENLKQKLYQAYKVAYNDDNNNIAGI